MIKQLTFAFISLQLLVSLSLFSQTKQDVSDNLIYKSINKHASVFLKNKEINSVSIGLYKDGKTYTRHFGELIKGKGNLPNDNSVYEIASVTKTMTGYLVAKAVLEGKIKLEDDIRMYLNGDFDNLEYDNQAITLQHLLTHTSGLPKFLPLKMNTVFEQFNKTVPLVYYELEKAYSKTQFFEDLKAVKITTKPGNNYVYSNAGAEIVGYILETIYKTDIETIFQEHLLQEQKMTHTSILPQDTQKQNLVQGYWMQNTEPSPEQLNTLWGTGSGIKSTLPDLLKYIQLQLDQENPIVTKSHEVLYEAGKTFKIAYFWRVWYDKYGTSYNHHGGTSGIQNWIYIYPKYNIGFTIITNHSGPKTPGKLNKIVKKILKDLIKA